VVRRCVGPFGQPLAHYFPDNLESDRQRDAVFEELAILTIRFRNEEIALDWSACAQKILFACIDRDSGNDSDAEFE